jgi:hypothetical protein
MSNDEIEVIRALRDKGYLIVIWTPEELMHINTDYLEDIIIEKGNDTIEHFKSI